MYITEINNDSLLGKHVYKVFRNTCSRCIISVVAALKPCVKKMVDAS